MSHLLCSGFETMELASNCSMASEYIYTYTHIYIAQRAPFCLALVGDGSSLRACCPPYVFYKKVSKSQLHHYEYFQHDSYFKLKTYPLYC